MARRGENIYKRKDGRYEGRYRVGYNSAGKPKYRSVYAKSYGEVKEKLLKLKAASEAFQTSGHLTVYELFEEWFTAVSLRVKASTLSNYRMKADKHILPAFGNVRYDKLTPEMVHRFIHQKLHDGLSAKYISDIVIEFKTMANYISKTYGFRNPLSAVSLPKAEPKEMQLMAPAQEKRLCHYLITHLNPTTLGILLSLQMGLRIGEICGLRWEDIDLNHRILTVRRTVQRIMMQTGTRLRTDSPKSRGSHRCIPIPGDLCRVLSQFYGQGYLLTGSEKLTEPRTMQRRFRTILQKVQLPSMHYHTLRHQFATNCIRAGFDVKTLSEILGHASVETTLKLYVHSSFARKVECMNLLKLAV